MHDDPAALLSGPPTIRTRRIPRCATCALPPPLCLCAELPALAVSSRARVVLLMHCAEQHKSTSTARLLARVLPGAVLRIRGASSRAQPPPLPEGRRLLLFPHPAAPVLSPAMVGSDPVVLLVPDGTWKQARRITQRDPDARDAEPVSLAPGPPSRYGLRRNPLPGTLSTFEAVARALGALEGAELEARLMEAFDLWVARSLEVRERGELVAEACRAQSARAP